jgi:hypothetical protein
MKEPGVDSRGEDLLLSTRQPLSSVLRDLKRESNDLWSCINSLLEDERFVAELRWGAISTWHNRFAATCPLTLPPDSAQSLTAA